jgi:hypothetical protein
MSTTLESMEREFRRDYLLEMRERNHARRERARDAMARTRGALAARFANKSGLQLLVHPSTKPGRDGQWQITSIGYDGKPFGHCCAPSFDEAVLRCVGASQNGYWNEYGYSLVEVAGVRS